MAKKNTTEKKVTKTDNNVEVKPVETTTKLVGEEVKTVSTEAPGIITKIAKKKIEGISIVDLMAYEKACNVICKRYEVTARLDGMNNAKLKEISEYHRDILTEIEKRIITLCKE